MTGELLVARCGYDAASYAVNHWHYSHCLPMPPRVHYGVWEQGLFIGAVIFAPGTNRNLVRPYGLLPTQGAELARVALGRHNASVSEIVSRAVRRLKVENPGLRLLVSFADPARGHVGVIYQAMNWIYAGTSAPKIVYRDGEGKLYHPRSLWAADQAYRAGLPTGGGLLISDAEQVVMPGKHRYLFPLDRAMARQIAPLAQPYPKRGQ